MNRTWINFLSIVIIAIISVMVVVPFVSFLAGFTDGLTSSEVSSNNDFTNFSPIEIAINNSADNLINPADSLTLDDGVTYPFTPTSGIIHIPDQKIAGWTQPTLIIGYALAFAFYIYMLVYFIKFIININRGNVFVRLNVKYLQHIAGGLLCTGLVQTLCGLCENILVSDLNLKMGNSELLANWSIPWTILLLGFLSLLMSQVWARGIELREDQEFTI